MRMALATRTDMYHAVQEALLRPRTHGNHACGAVNPLSSFGGCVRHVARGRHAEGQRLLEMSLPTCTPCTVYAVLSNLVQNH